MAYEELENLKKMVQKMNEQMANEADNYAALTVQCQDLLKKLDEQKNITNKYGQFFADIYRTLENDAQLEGELNMPNPEAKILYRTIDLIELQASETIDSDLAAKRDELIRLENQIKEKEAELKAIQKDASFTAHDLEKDQRNLRTVQEDICYAMRDQQNLRFSSPPAQTRNSRQSQRKLVNVEKMIDRLPDVPQKQSPQPQQEENIVAQKPEESKQADPSPAIPPNPTNIELKSFKGFLIPEQPQKDHLYLCTDNGASPIEITDFVDIRVNHLVRFGSDFSRTYRPQFRLLNRTGKRFVGEQQGINNLLNGKQLAGEMELHSGDELTITDKDGKQHKLMFVFS